MSESSLRYFTLEEANATLPYVRSIVTDVVAAYEEWREHVARYEVMAANSRSVDGETDAQVTLRTEVDRIARLIGGYLSELEKVGCTFKGLDPTCEKGASPLPPSLTGTTSHRQRKMWSKPAADRLK